MKTCPTCGGHVEGNAVGRPRVYCSKLCQQRRPGRKTPPAEPRPCSVCGRLFTPAPQHAKTQHRCSADCGRRGQQPCPYCGELIADLKRKQCGRASCLRRLKADRMRNYMRTRRADPVTAAKHLEYDRKAHRRRLETLGHWRVIYPERAARTDALRRLRVQAATVEDFAPRDVYERDGWVCQLCRLPIDPRIAWPDSMSPSVDHRVPLAKGGEHSMANAQAAHLGCNSRKRDRLDGPGPADDHAEVA